MLDKINRNFIDAIEPRELEHCLLELPLYSR